MYQFYFLSIVCNVLTGIILASDYLEEKFPVLQQLNGNFLGKSEFRTWLGVSTLVVGVFKLLSVTYGDVILIGDILPAAAGIAGGATLVLEYYREKASTDSRLFDSLENILGRNKTVWGLFCIASGVLHFFFPSVLFL